MAASASAALENMIEEVDEEDSDEYSDDGLFAGINLKALKQRGKGKYYCPRGHRCDKGGVDKNGNLILFDRNSSFAYVASLTICPLSCSFIPIFNPGRCGKEVHQDGRHMPRLARLLIYIHAGNIATNIASPGGAMCLAARILPRSAGLRAVTDWRGTKLQSSTTLWRKYT